MNKKKILIVDDEKNIRMTVKNCLNETEYLVDIAVNGEEGYEMIQSTQYDLVLLDIKMPGLSGMEVLKKVRDSNSTVSVVMMTAYGTVENAVEAMKLGAVDFLSKPFTPDEIRTVVKKVTLRKDLEEVNLESYSDLIEFAKKCIIDKEFGKAATFLKKAISIEVEAADPHNLLGVLSEMNMDVRKAQIHYRAALALEPSHKAASNNLSRTTNYSYTKNGIDLGENLEKGKS
ncbi:response regulator [Petrocella sp. FN5]|uniref:response regulator n=1 Tax=Petrocella sp. FN5 TaxID=3032002 RepID=UPI0023DB9B4A|nr:response regulator [Petrocella sp. FN5]MDF1615937.1 response regulator [Petrocella sp. FN5]